MKQQSKIFVCTLILLLSSCGSSINSSTPLVDTSTNSSNTESTIYTTSNTSISTANKDLDFITTSDGLLVNGRGNCVDKNIIIPSDIDGKPVISIVAEAFKNDIALESITLPDSLTLIEREAFSGCNSLKEVFVGSNLKEIGYGAFYWCTSLKNITLPNTLENIGQIAFFDSGLYRSANSWDNGIFYIDQYIIDGGKAEGVCNIKEGVRGVADAAFYNNSQITELTLPTTINFLGKMSLTYLSNMQKLTIGKNLVPDIYIRNNFVIDTTFVDESLVRYIRK